MGVHTFTRAAALACVATLALAACGSTDPGETPTETTTTQPAPTATAPSPEPSPSGPAAPPAQDGGVPAADPAPADLLDQLAPGYFLVSFQTDKPKRVDSAGSPGRVERVRGFLAVVTADGVVYNVADLTEQKVSDLGEWKGTRVVAWRDTRAADSFYGEGDVLRIDLLTGETKKIATGAERFTWMGSGVDGAVGGSFGGESSQVAIYPNYDAAKSLCDHMGLPDERLVSPDGTKVVCFEWAGGSSKTQVVSAKTSSPYTASNVQRLREHPFSYYVKGWVEKDRLLFSRVVSESAPTYFTLDLASGDVRDFDLPFRSERDEFTLYFDQQVFGDLAEDSARFYDRDGRVVAEVSCGIPDVELYARDVAVSGERALVRCAQSRYADDPQAELWLVDLASGAVSLVGRYDAVGEYDAVSQIFGYPAK